ncbi:ABC transporter ATP-binding protein [Kineosporia succinea]|uniref:Peptide/nickel transport system ATP-binding protein/oligopeptide transport system ATP-binding protein n=1 Tax=Kineosporia succinea TaxID=84632 RepID=A0ABT9P955_9ACTN|nr:ABC transporter ATP-binding protein [Kineosporia succinea]MDP9828560.1 peptide/nickel transport system ATP-binding protein/oligopeptide transport system ATP-binding protein [Kineosporia succinea]
MKPVPLLQLTGLRVEYSRPGGQKVRAVRDVDLVIAEGETLGLVGESGCGKSSLGRAVLRAIEPQAGRIDFLGLDITHLKGAPLRRVWADLQMIFQDPFGSLNPRRKVVDIIAEPVVRARGATRQEAEERAGELLEKVGLGRDAGQRRPREFSGGQRQRIAIARALAPSPRFVVADEPVSALDVSIQAQVVNLLADLTETSNLTCLFISHDLGVVRQLADRVAVMYLGQIIEIAERDRFFAGPAHPYSSALLASVPRVTAVAEPKAAQLQGDPPDPADPPAGCLFSTRCPAATELCRTEQPVLRELGPGHDVRCHFPLEPLEHA